MISRKLLLLCLILAGGCSVHAAPQTKPNIVELYDLAADIGEKQNLVGQNPEVVKRLSAILEKYERENRSRF
ncbi:MAG: hypothetical protein H0X66_18760 [Verrucomicrobia bacterium]|nr:hypothetical protein [Verrucomicrobiota bacterium]